MNNKLLKWMVAIMVAIVILITVSVIHDRVRENNKNEFTFKPGIVVINNSSIPYIDTMVAVMLDNVFGYDTMYVSIVDIPHPVGTKDIDLYAFIEQNPFSKRAYYLFVDPRMSKSMKLTIVAHEMVHLDQMESGRLIGLPWLPGKIYNGDTIDFKKVPYEQRQFEIDAFLIGPEYEKILKNLIYN
jgi:hypothetical protein